MKRLLAACGLLMVLALPACRGHASAPGESLYQRLGGGPALNELVDDFLDVVVADSRINHYFVDSDLGALKTSFVNLIGQATGGPEHYAGADLTTVHAKLGVTAPDFDAFMDDLGRTLDTHHLRAREKTELLGLFNAMKSQVVTH